MLKLKLPTKQDVNAILLAGLFFLIPLDYVLPHIGSATCVTIISIAIILYGVFLIITGSKTVRLSKESKILLVMTLIYFASVIWAIEKSAALARMFPILNTFLLYITATQFKYTKKQIRWMENGAILGAVILALYVFRYVDLSLVFAGYRLKFSLLGSEYFSDPNGLAGRLLFPVLIVIDRVQKKQKVYVRIIYIGILLLCAYFLLLTGSRAGMIAIIIGVFITLLQGFRNKNKWVVISTLVIIVAVYFGLNYLPSHIVNRIFNFLGYKSVATVQGDRIDIWKHVLELFVRSPLIGYGGGNAGNALKEFYGYAKAVHNSYLSVLCELGLLGFIPWMIFVFKKIKSAFLLRRTNPMIFASVVAVIFMAATLDAFTEKYLWSIFIYIYIYREAELAELVSDTGGAENDKVIDGLPRIC